MADLSQYDIFLFNDQKDFLKKHFEIFNSDSLEYDRISYNGRINRKRDYRSLKHIWKTKKDFEKIVGNHIFMIIYKKYE